MGQLISHEKILKPCVFTHSLIRAQINTIGTGDVWLI